MGAVQQEFRFNKPASLSELTSKQAWTPDDAPVIADLLGFQYRDRFQKEFETLLQNKVFQEWVQKGKDPMIFAQMYFDDLSPAELPRIPQAIE